VYTITTSTCIYRYGLFDSSTTSWNCRYPCSRNGSRTDQWLLLYFGSYIFIQWKLLSIGRPLKSSEEGNKKYTKNNTHFHQTAKLFRGNVNSEMVNFSTSMW